jgi:hypothetical protein
VTSAGAGVAAAVRGAEIIVHCAGSSKGDEQKTRALVSAATDARHIVLISVVGADRIPQGCTIDRALFGYFGMKPPSGSSSSPAPAGPRCGPPNSTT